MAIRGRPRENIMFDIKGTPSSSSVASYVRRPTVSVYIGTGYMVVREDRNRMERFVLTKEKQLFYFGYKSYLFYNEVTHTENSLPSLIV
jgi:hypothetical protein